MKYDYYEAEDNVNCETIMNATSGPQSEYEVPLKWTPLGPTVL